ncbi:hypothetical protein ACWIGI_28605 [Nocardia sp. NPDC055321]
MSAPEMVLQYIEALKWPVVTGGIIFWLRNPLGGLVARMQGGRVEAPGGFALEVTAEIAGQAAQTAQEISAADERRTADEEPAETDDSPGSDPALAAALRLSPAERNTVDAGVVDLFGAIRSPARTGNAVEDLMSFWAEFQLCLATIVDPLDTAPTVRQGRYRIRLWPGTDKWYEDTLRQLIELYTSIRSHPEQTTNYATTRFRNGVGEWSHLYGRFVVRQLGAAAEAEST